jgi:dipeptidyl-peptidase-4
MRRFLSLNLIVLAMLALVFVSPAFAQERQLTIDLIFDPQQRLDFSGSPPSLRWLGDGTHYLLTKRDRQTRRSELLRVNALTGATSPFLDPAAETAFASLPGITPEDARRLAAGDLFDFNPAQTAALVNFKNDLYFYDRTANKAERLTNDAAVEESVETFSPDGKLVAFVRNNDLYVVEVATKRERRLTSDGSTKIFNGRLNWVYQEELYGRGNFKSFWWSPDGKQIAYLKLDDSPVSSFAVVDHIPRLQEVEMTPYPKAGDPNPLVRLGVVAATGGDTKFVDLRAYEPTNLLISRVTWSPDNRRVIYQAQDRAQTFLDLNAADPSSGETRTLLREASKFAKGDTVGSLPARAWVEAIDNPSYLRDNSFRVAKRPRRLATSLSLCG